MSKLLEPAVAMPVLLALVALLGVSLLDEEPRRPAARRDTEEVDQPGDRLDDFDASSLRYARLADHCGPVVLVMISVSFDVIAPRALHRGPVPNDRPWRSRGAERGRDHGRGPLACARALATLFGVVSSPTLP